MLTVRLEQMYALLDYGAIPDIIYQRLAEKLKLEIEPTNQSIVEANKAKVDEQGMVSYVPLVLVDKLSALIS